MLTVGPKREMAHYKKIGKFFLIVNMTWELKMKECFRAGGLGSSEWRGIATPPVRSFCTALPQEIFDSSSRNIHI